jgi:hypothetical protein
MNAQLHSYVTMSKATACFLSLFFLNGMADTRVWHSTQGHQFEGRLVEYREDRVVLEGADGRNVTLPLNALRVEDRHHVVTNTPVPEELLVRIWRTQSGHETLAHLLDVNEDGALLEWENGRQRIPVELFREEEQEVLGRWHQAHLEKIRKQNLEIIRGMLDLPFHRVEPGGRFQEFRLTVPEDLHALLSEKYQDKREIVAGIRVPETFDPRKPYGVYIPFMTSGGSGTHIQRGAHYARHVDADNWIVLGAGWAEKEDERPWVATYVALMTLMRNLEEHWPGFSHWPIATGGFSGGAKWAGGMAMMLNADGFNVIGVYMGGCNEAFAARYKNHLGTRTADCADIAMFMSNGTRDNIANERHADAMTRELTEASFRHLRRELYDGTHSEHIPHFRDALAWFLEVHPLPDEILPEQKNNPVSGFRDEPSQKRWVRRLRSNNMFL